MQPRLQHLRDDERGMSLVYVAMGFMGFLTATTLSIDVGMFMTARSQAQNSADAGALAGAVALAFNDFDDRSASGPAVQSAISTAVANGVMGSPVSIGPGDVTFPNDPNGQPTRVRVSVYRATVRNNAIPTLMGSLFGVSTVSLGAQATAEVSPANAATCVKPFTIPDKWEEHQDPTWTVDSTFDVVDKKGQPIADPDVYHDVHQGNYTGYDPERDKGLQLILKANNQDKAAPSFYNPWDQPGSEGGDDYRDNISGCNPNIIAIGERMEPENGNMVGPTDDGTQMLLDRDPTAYWNDDCKCVKGSAFATSPRIAIIPVYDPMIYALGKQNGNTADLYVANHIGFFIEELVGNEVVGRIMPVAGVADGSAGPAPVGAFAKVIRLVE